MEIFLTLRADKTLLALADRILNVGRQILEKENQIMATLQEAVNAIAEETTADASIITLLTQLHDLVVAGTTGLTAEQQAKIDTIFSGAKANVASITAAVAANVPPAPPPVTVPPVV